MELDKKKIEKHLEEIRDANWEIKGADGNPIVVPPEGSLGLLSIGYKGLMVWRKAKQEKNKQADKK